MHKRPARWQPFPVQVSHHDPHFPQKTLTQKQNTNTDTHARTHTHEKTQTNTHTHPHTHTQTHERMSTGTHKHTNTRTQEHMNAHTHRRCLCKNPVVKWSEPGTSHHAGIWSPVRGQSPRAHAGPMPAGLQKKATHGCPVASLG